MILLLKIIVALAVSGALCLLHAVTSGEEEETDKEPKYFEYSETERYILCPACGQDIDVAQEPAKGSLCECPRCDKRFSFDV